MSETTWLIKVSLSDLFISVHQKICFLGPAECFFSNLVLLSCLYSVCLFQCFSKVWPISTICSSIENCVSLYSQCISKWAYFPILSWRFLCFSLSLCRVVAVYLYIYFSFFSKDGWVNSRAPPTHLFFPSSFLRWSQKILSTFWPQPVTTSFLLFTLLDHS